MEIFVQKQDLGNLDIFREIYDFAENQKHQNINTLVILRFKESTQSLEGKSRNFIEASDTDIAKIANSYLELSLRVFLHVLKRGGLLERPILSAYFRYLNFLHLIFNRKNSSTNALSFSRNFTKNFPALLGPKAQYHSSYIKNHLNYGIPVDLVGNKPFFSEMNYKELELSIEHDFNLRDKTISQYDKEIELINFYQKGFIVHQYIFNSNNDIPVFQNEYYEYILDLGIDNKQKDAQRMASALFKILSSISSIENAKVEFEHLEKGSIFGRIKVRMKDFVAKSEVKNFFILLRELLFGISTGGKVSAIDTLKKTAELDKIEMEKKLIQKKLDEESEEKLLYENRLLDIDKKQLENQSLELKNTAAYLSNIKTIVELAKEGILEADLIKIDLNGINFINTHGEKIIDSEEDIDKMT